MFDAAAQLDAKTDRAGGGMFDGLMLTEHAHRIANDMAVAIAELDACRRRTTDSETSRALTQAIDRLHGISGVQRRLVRPAGGDVEFDAVLADLCEAVLRARAGSRAIDLDTRLEPMRIEARTAWRLATVVAELLTNALKHGLAGRDGRLEVSLARRGPGLTCVVTDDGVGGRRHSGTGHGSRIVEDIIEEMGGNLERRSSAAGTSVLIALPETFADQVPAEERLRHGIQ